ncbi:PucR family transcriptional regulator [Brevibacillus fulvus]|uniref:Purine catabolism regulator n=1 Tax=Brevibacillus fulvus TaxID=1125967 RepID=A0A939BTG6_9BACL|nr:PucR family transcriptional regulator ligand-binding domain-containing protein [Brevibacillus fulvus]MBM7588421.1 purine catabolism regulator [Brevibacillus fulvus]
MTITIREAIQLPDMVQTRLVAGEAGLDNVIRWVTIVEILEDVTRLQEGEFLITTGYGLQDTPEKMANFIPSLVARKLSGVALHTGFYLQEIPAFLRKMADRHSLPLIEIPAQLNFSTVTRAILQPIINRQFETMAYSAAIHHQMIEAALSHGGLPAIAKILAELTGGRVELSDVFGDRVLTIGDSPETSIDSQTGFTVPIRAHLETYGQLTLTKPQNQWQELDYIAIKHAATLCALEYMKERAIVTTEWRMQGDLAEELLQGRATAGRELEARSQMLGYSLTGRHLVAAIQVGQCGPAALPSAEQSTRVSTIVQRLVARKQISCLSRQRSDLLLLLLHARPENERFLRDFVKEWTRLYPQEPVQVGVSLARSQLSELGEAAKEAIFSVKTAPLVGGRRHVLRYDELQGYQFLFPFHQQAQQLEMLWRPLLAKLLEHDQKHGQQLFETLQVYFRQNLNGLQSAQALYIHRHTLKYRLQQIEEKTGCDLSDHAQRWQLQLAVMAYRLHHLLYPEDLPIPKSL